MTEFLREQGAPLLDKTSSFLMSLRSSLFSLPWFFCKALQVKISVTGEPAERLSGQTSLPRLILHLGKRSTHSFDSHLKCGASQSGLEPPHSSYCWNPSCKACLSRRNAESLLLLLPLSCREWMLPILDLEKNWVQVHPNSNQRYTPPPREREQPNS